MFKIKISSLLSLSVAFILISMSLSHAKTYTKEEFIAMGGQSITGTVLKVGAYNFIIRTEQREELNIHTGKSMVRRFHVGIEPPVVFDCRMKPWYPHVLEVDDQTRRLVDSKIGDILPSQYR